MQVIHPKQRLRWDAFCSLVIVIAAFEIPYDLLVGWKDHVWQRIFDSVLVTVFVWDIYLNSRTIQPRSFAGFWGWRHVAGLFNSDWSAAAARRRTQSADTLLTSPKEVFVGYLKSVWFPIDVIATIPFNLLLTGATWLNFSRLVKLLRTARLLRLLRLSKSLRFAMQMRRWASGFPSLGRILVAILLVPWVAHIHACFYYYFETQNPAMEALTYSDAIHAVFVTFTTGDEAAFTTVGSFWVVVSAVIFQVVLIATITGNIAAVLTSLRLKEKPHRDYLRADHTIILGWDTTIYSVISQLTSEDEGPAGEIVILCNRSVDRMWQDIGLNCPFLRPGVVDVQHGSICFAQNIRDLNISMAKQVLILGDESSEVREDSSQVDAWKSHFHDAQVLKSILACANALASEATVETDMGGVETMQQRRIPVIAAVQSNEASVVLEFGVPDSVKQMIQLKIVAVDDTLTRCMAQVIADPYLAPVYQSLFSYEESIPGRVAAQSSELYCVTIPEVLVGRSFHDCMFEYTSAIPIGYITSAQNGTTESRRLSLNPPAGSESGNYLFRSGDQLVLVAESLTDVKWRPSERPKFEAWQPRSMVQQPQSVLVLGDRHVVDAVLGFLPEYLPDGSRIRSNSPEFAEEFRQRIQLDAIAAEETIRTDAYGRLDITSAIQAERLSDFDVVAIIADLDDAVLHDNRILMALAGICANASRQGWPRFIVTQLFDPANQPAASVFGNPSAIISSELASNYMVQLAQEPDRGLVFDELLDPRGQEVYTRPVESYLSDDSEEICFNEIRARACSLQEIAIGYCPRGKRRVRLCPKDRSTAKPASEYGRIVVLAEEQVQTPLQNK